MQKKLLKVTLIIFIAMLFILSVNAIATEDEINANSDVIVGSDSESDNTTQDLLSEDSDEETEAENEESLSDETNENVVDEENVRY